MKSLINRLSNGLIHKRNEFSEKSGKFHIYGGYYVHESIYEQPWRSLVRIPFKSLKNFCGLIQGYSGCMRCGDSWYWKKEHVIETCDGHGMFPLCKECWNNTNKEEKKSYVIALVSSWLSSSHHSPAREQSIRNQYETALEKIDENE